MNTLETLLEHRSIRKYSNKAISDEVLNTILDASFRAPTTGNMQLYSVVVNKEKEMKEKLAPMHFNQPMIKNSELVMTFCADINRFNKWCDINNAEHGYDNLLWFLTAATDALIAAQNACVAAEAQGVGTCWLGTVTYNADQIIDLLKLPKGVVPVACITMGYPDEQVNKTDRLPAKAIVHYEEYEDFSEEKIRDLYSVKEALQENIDFIKENNKENLAKVFTDIRYKKKDNEFFSDKFKEVLKKQGFIE